MIFARGSDSEGGQAFILGLSRGNIELLMGGKPIRLTQETHGKGVPDGWTIVILYGETEQSMADDLARTGAILPTTEVIHDPRL